MGLRNGFRSMEVVSSSSSIINKHSAEFLWAQPGLLKCILGHTLAATDVPPLWKIWTLRSRPRGDNYQAPVWKISSKARGLTFNPCFLMALSGAANYNPAKINLQRCVRVPIFIMDFIFFVLFFAVVLLSCTRSLLPLLRFLKRPQGAPNTRRWDKVFWSVNRACRRLGDALTRRASKQLKKQTPTSGSLWLFDPSQLLLLQ